MRIIFFGTGKFGLPSLKKLLHSRHDILAVVTRPDTKKGRRGTDVLPAPVRAYAEKAAPGVEIFQPPDVSDPGFVERVEKERPDVFVVVDYGCLLGEELLGIPEKCGVNLHPSLLPKYRGAAPVNWAIMNGEKETGNTVIQMTERMDAGSIIVQERTLIGENEKAQELLERLAKSGAALLMKALDMIESEDLQLAEQDDAGATAAPRLRKQDGRIEWGDPALRIVRKVRAMQPWPGAFTLLNGRTLKILEAEAVSVVGEGLLPGAIMDNVEFIVKTGEDAVRIDALQLEGKKIMRREEFLRGYRLTRGVILGA
ncbi:MAG: methionyl-tRNA formyltransferase [Candidatus Omnitrophica bacterium]|nr:methionyl-tRNA formyltransferase [Candidatus Omnitrophota bacterium]